MDRLARIIQHHHPAIISRWRSEATRCASARGLTQPDFNNLMPSYLTGLGEALRSASPRLRISARLVEGHVSARLRQGFHAAEVVEEFALLGRCISAVSAELPSEERATFEEVDWLFTELAAASAAVLDLFHRHLANDEQTEKRYVRLLQAIASEALAPNVPTFRDRLGEVLDLILEAMSAQAAALLLYQADTQQLVTVASAGAANEKLEHYATSLSPSTFPGQVAADAEPSEIEDAQTTTIELSDSLRRAGIQALLGVRLPPHHRLLGVLYVGRSERGAFSAGDRRRIESLGDKLALHLDNAALYADRLEKIAALQAERTLRERFVSMLAHDLRGPLSTAKLTAHCLSRYPERLDTRRDLADRIIRSIDRTDRMVSDLLDANRIRSGERLSLRLASCDLSAIAGDVIKDLQAVDSSRLVFVAPEPVEGVWSADVLRRALWNLVSNAVKYGEAGAPITVTIQRRGGQAFASVHNHGEPINAEDQQRLFVPFSRTRSAELGPASGWGLGLTLVSGCAQAHGGRIGVRSERGEGTTFTLQLPLDSRPFQPAADSTPQLSASGDDALQLQPL